MPKISVDPGLWEGLDYLLGTTLAEKAHEFGISYNPKFDVEKAKDITIIDRAVIGSAQFNVDALASDAEAIANFFGADQSFIDRLVGSTGEEKFQKTLDLLDFILSGVKVVSLDKFDEAKECVSIVAMSLSKYAPDMKTMSKILSMIPGISKYSKYIMGFGESMDKALSILNVGGDDCISEAIDTMRDGIKKLKKINIDEVSKQAIEGKVDEKDVIDAEPAEVTPVKDDSDENKGNKSKKKKETTEVTSENIAEKAAMNTGAIPPGMGWVTPASETEGNLPAFMQGADRLTPNSNGQLPEFMSQNQLNVPKPNPTAMVFNPVQQNQQFDPRLVNYQFVNQIIQLANSVGYYVMPELIIDNGDERPVLVYFRTFNTNNFLVDKSFVVDLGTVIDQRYGIWPCANPNGAYNVLESCTVAYALYKRDNTLNTELLLDIIKFGFSNIKPKKEDILYGERMCITNRRIALISMQLPVSSKLDKGDRNIIRGACIRMATQLDPSLGRFEFKSIEPQTLEFVLTNKNMGPYFLVPGPVPPVVTELYCTPALDENGNRIPVNEKGGGDIKYNIQIVTNPQN